MKENDLSKRTKSFALRIMKLIGALPNTVAGRAIGGQLIRSGMSVSANYRAACRARSRAEFIAKLGIVEEEADETVYWIELLIDAGIVQLTRVRDLLKEADEIIAITVSSIKSAKGLRKAH